MHINCEVTPASCIAAAFGDLGDGVQRSENRKYTTAEEADVDNRGKIKMGEVSAYDFKPDHLAHWPCAQ